jgi:hypothetical protein
MSTGFKGQKHSEETRQKIASKLKGRTWSCTPKGKPLSQTLKEKLSQAHIGKISGFKGRRHTKESKLKIRLARIRQQQECGSKIDEGATEFFNNLNQTQGLHIQHPNVYFSELGYFADGYDPVLHAWFEYDTKSHRPSFVKQRDVLRQTEIIEYFKFIHKPLTGFYRINQTGLGKPGMVNILCT